MINDSEFILLALSFKMRIIQVSLLLAFLLTTVVSQDDPDESWSIGRQVSLTNLYFLLIKNTGSPTLWYL